MATSRFPTTANSPLTAKGDLFTFSTGSAKLAVGNDGEQIVADSSTSTGLKWATPAAAASGLTVIKAKTTFTAVADTGTTFDSVLSNTYENYVFVINLLGSGSGNEFQMQYLYSGTAQTTSYYSNVLQVNDSGTQSIRTNSNIANIVFGVSSTNTNLAPYTVNLHRVTTNGMWMYGQGQSIGSSLVINTFGGNNYTSRTYTGFKLLTSTGTITGDVTVYGLGTA